LLLDAIAVLRAGADAGRCGIGQHYACRRKEWQTSDLRKLTEVLPLSALAKKEKVFLVSITHLASDRRLAIAREIAAYQKRRIKRIRRDSATDSGATYH
jgi:hypothetical protein